MIGRLKGLIDGYGEDWVLIDVRGVCYVVHASARTLAALPPVGEAASVSIETFVREDQIRLFGFASDMERDWFRLLLGVQGVGTKVALAILSALAPDDLAAAVALQDKAAVSQAQGVGPKVAQRIVTELKDKAPKFGGDSSLAQVSAELDANAPSAVADAVSALVNLGYAQMQAGAAVAKARQTAGEDADTAELIRRGLKELMQ
ncbi:MAG: Holliday junction branch migration protein RuvA [Hyphomicrobiales bacterium]|nr:MAG: Holliday junction branch migration protein RuvA [Hyphomicrobiales bacterium]